MSEQLETRSVDYLLEEIVTLPSLPTAVARISQLVRDPDCSLADVSQAISTDPALALKALRLVNSAYYGLGQKVTSVSHAVTLLGLKVIKNLVLTATVFETLQKGADRLLRHSLATGVAMRVIAEANSENSLAPDDSFVYGLFHDIGKIVFEEYLPKEFAAANQLCTTKNLPPYMAEKEVIGVDHAEMGSRLVQNWKLPDQLYNAVAAHHDLTRCENPDVLPYAAMLCAADYLATSTGVSGSEFELVQADEQVWVAANITSQAVPRLIDQYIEELPAVEEFLQIASA